MKIFTIGDIHGAYRALRQCLDRSDFNYKKDTLITLGDLNDGWSETPQVIEELKKIKNIIVIIGNHDHWAIEWLNYGTSPTIWTGQGGQATIDAYLRNSNLIASHREFWKQGVYYYLDDKNRCYCHGGFHRGADIRKEPPEILMWDRSLAEKCVAGAKTGFKVYEYKHVFLGHTTVNIFNEKRVSKNKPFTGGNITLMDTGGGWEGVVTIMDVNKMKYWQSDLVSKLYPEEKRGKL